MSSEPRRARTSPPLRRPRHEPRSPRRRGAACAPSAPLPRGRRRCREREQPEQPAVLRGAEQRPPSEHAVQAQRGECASLPAAIGAGRGTVVHWAPPRAPAAAPRLGPQCSRSRGMEPGDAPRASVTANPLQPATSKHRRPAIRAPSARGTTSTRASMADDEPGGQPLERLRRHVETGRDASARPSTGAGARRRPPSTSASRVCAPGQLIRLGLDRQRATLAAAAAARSRRRARARASATRRRERPCRAASPAASPRGVEHDQRAHVAVGAQPALEQAGPARERRPVDPRRRRAGLVGPQAVDLDRHERAARATAPGRVELAARPRRRATGRARSAAARAPAWRGGVAPPTVARESPSGSCTPAPAARPCAARDVEARDEPDRRRAPAGAQPQRLAGDRVVDLGAAQARARPRAPRPSPRAARPRSRARRRSRRLDRHTAGDGRDRGDGAARAA